MIQRSLWFLGSLSLCFVLSACQQQIEFSERTRLTSPSGEFDAVLTEWPTNATGDFLFGVAIVEKGKPVSTSEMLVTGSSLIEDGLHWDNDRTLVLHYGRGGQIYSFKNRWYPPETLTGKSVRSIEILLLPDQYSN